MVISASSGILSISVDTKKVENMLNGYQRTIPRAGRKATKKIAGMYAAFYFAQFSRSRISPFTGHAYTRVESQINNPTKLSKDSYGVVIPQYMVWLDKMEPHWVSLKRGRSITLWAKKKLGYVPRALMVHPHPWIKQAHIRAGKNVRTIAEFEINNAIKGRGR